MKHDLIVFGEDWNRHPSSTQHLIKELGRDRKLIWVNSIGLRRPRLTIRDAVRVLEKVKSWFGMGNFANNEGSSVDDVEHRFSQFQVISPWVFPAARSRLVRALNRGILSWQIRRVAKRMCMRRRDLWVSLPTAVDWVGHLNESKVLYYCGDDFSALAGVDHAHVAQCERELAHKSTHILVASATLHHKFNAISNWKNKTMLVEHGVDTALFSTPAPCAQVLEGQRPVAGFYGSIADWLDLSMLAQVARALPNWRFVLMGRVETDLSAIKTVENIELLPPVAHHLLPRYAQHWQASLLPFRDCEQIHACNPLKLREYLAVGKPVVSTPFPALEPYRSVVNEVTSAEQMVNALLAIENSYSSFHHERRACVKHESWLARAQQLQTVLSSS